jgi:hypothetical protein
VDQAAERDHQMQPARAVLLSDGKIFVSPRLIIPGGLSMCKPMTGLLCEAIWIGYIVMGKPPENFPSRVVSLLQAKQSGSSWLY